MAASVFAIVLQVLKIIGFVLLGILALILLILNLILWVPIRYKGKVRYHEKANGRVTVSWLLHLVSASLVITDNALSTRIRILGFIPIGEKKASSGETPPEEGESPPGSEETPEEEFSEKSRDDSLIHDDIPEERWEQKASERDLTGLDEEMDSTAGETEGEPGKTPGGRSSGTSGKRPGFFEFYRDKMKALYEKLNTSVPELWQSMKDKYADLKEKYESLKDKYDFLTRPQCKRAIRRILKKLLRMLRHIIPKKLRGTLDLGLASPADTGTVYGIFCSLYPIHKGALQMNPDFEEQKVDADVMLRGRIFIGVLLVIAISAVLNKDVLYLLKNLKKHFGNKKSQEGRSHGRNH